MNHQENAITIMENVIALLAFLFTRDPLQEQGLTLIEPQTRGQEQDFFPLRQTYYWVD